MNDTPAWFWRTRCRPKATPSTVRPVGADTEKSPRPELARDQARELLKGAHSADADVYNCHIILSHLIALMVKPGEPTTWEEIWRRSELARIPTVMTFGKHKGTPIKDVPADYKRWLLGQPDIDPYLQKALREAAA